MPQKPIIAMNLDCSETGGELVFSIRRAYVRAVRMAGGTPLLAPCVPDRGFLKTFVDHADGFLFIGGKDYPGKLFGQRNHERANIIHPLRSATDSILAKLVLGRRIPVLGICGGEQLLSVAVRGKLIQHLPNHRKHASGVQHRVRIEKQSLVYGIFKSTSINVNSHHHQAVDPNYPGRGMRISAISPDGVIEAIEMPGHPFLLGTQWHPERMSTPHHQKVFKAFVRAAKKGITT